MKKERKSRVSIEVRKGEGEMVKGKSKNKAKELTLDEIYEKNLLEVQNSLSLKILNSIIKGWVAEYRFADDRKWRFDFANPALKIAVEIEGGIWTKGRHVRGYGFLNDMEKYNKATLLGWSVLRYAPNQVGEMIRDIEELLRNRKTQRKKNTKGSK